MSKKTSYVSGSNSFLAYNQDGLLNGVEYAANLVIYQRFRNAHVEILNDYEDLLLTQIAITAGNLTGNINLTLELFAGFNGAYMMTPLWVKPCTAPDYTINDVTFFYESFNYPFFVGDALRFHNSNQANLDIHRVVFLFKPLVTKMLS
jgi:hypothetical protein